MSLPKSITLIRHDKTVFEEFQKSKKENKTYIEFRKAWDNNTFNNHTIELAKKISDKFTFNYSDDETPLAKNQEKHAEITGTKLKTIIPSPDVIFTSPYIRTKQTLERISTGWPELNNIQKIPDKLIREQDKGLESVYSDRRILFTFHPEQKKLFDTMGLYWYKYPHGENIPEVRLRVQTWINKLTSCFSEKNILAVAHYVSILAIVANLQNFSDKQFVEFLTKEEPDTCGITIFKNDAGVMKLDTYNMKLYK